jgi:hypothetical protein
MRRSASGTSRRGYVLFDHDYPKRMHKKGVGHTFLDVAAADIPGWYMTVYEGCG